MSSIREILHSSSHEVVGGIVVVQLCIFGLGYADSTTFPLSHGWVTGLFLSDSRAVLFKAKWGFDTLFIGVNSWFACLVRLRDSIQFLDLYTVWDSSESIKYAKKCNSL